MSNFMEMIDHTGDKVLVNLDLVTRVVPDGKEFTWVYFACADEKHPDSISIKMNYERLKEFILRL